jgi:secreted trypsin-like serine protease
MKGRLTIAACAALLLTACERGSSVAPSEPEIASPAMITYGTVAGTRFPAVVLIIMDVAGSPAYRCSGTVIAPKVVLTAGHCTGEPGEFSGMRIFTESDVQNGNNSYPDAGANTIEAASWQSYPGFSEATFFQHDVGVIVLQSPVNIAPSDFGTLPAANSLDALKPRNSTTFTSVGYGMQRVNPAKAVAEKVRMIAQPHLLQINTGFTGSFSMMLSNNASTGGTCFGDSGGPNFVGTSMVVGGVTSFALNGSCGGTGGVFRLDRPNVLAFVNSVLSANP